MIPVVQQEHAARAALHQKRHQRRVCLGRVAIAAGKDEVVGPVVCGLSAPGPDVVERDELGSCLSAAVGAECAMLRKKPIAVGLHAAAGRAAKSACRYCVSMSS